MHACYTARADAACTRACCCSGTVPPGYSAWKKLRTLYLFDNTALRGTLPATFSSMTSLTDLAIYNCSLTGTLPTSWKSMGQLRNLYLYTNNITGTIPAAWSGMQSMGDLELADNLLRWVQKRGGAHVMCCTFTHVMFSAQRD